MLNQMIISASHFCRRLKFGCIAGICLGLFCLTACAGKSVLPAHPLTSMSLPLTPTMTTSSLLSAKHVIPIQILQDQSLLSTYPGGQMRLVVRTNPYALCSFVLNYGSDTPDRDAGIVPATSDVTGMARWTWRVDGGAHTGVWPLTIYAVLSDGSKISAKASVTVGLPPISVITAQTRLQAYQGQTMSLAIATAPSKDCVLVVNLGPSKPIKYLKGRSSLQGNVSWQWRADMSASRGTWPLLVQVVLADGEKASLQLNVTVLGG